MKFGTALALSVLAHAVVGVGVGLSVAYTPATTLAQLDLTSVELSFAEDEQDTAPVAPLPPAPPPEPPQPKPREDPPPEIPPMDLTALPPDAAAVQLPEPPPEIEKVPPLPPLPQPTPTSAVAPRQARVQVEKPPAPKKAIRPDYPKASRQNGEEGDVVLEIRVNAHGRVDEVRIVASSGFARLDEAAVRAAHAARFTPAQAHGRAVASTARLTLTFKLK